MPGFFRYFRTSLFSGRRIRRVSAGDANRPLDRHRKATVKLIIDLEGNGFFKFLLNLIFQQFNFPFTGLTGLNLLRQSNFKHPRRHIDQGHIQILIRKILHIEFKR